MSSPTPAYDHTQRGYVHRLCYVAAAVILGVAWILRAQEHVSFPLLAASLATLVAARTFAQLHIYDRGDGLALRFGPLPLLRKTLPYELMESAEPGRSAFIDGWGMHWLPGRGWTYNLWGYDCVVVHMRNGSIARIGTDDRAGLSEFLQTRLRQGTTSR